MQNNRIVVIGSYLGALVMETDRIPLKGETLLARNFRQVHGGKGSNQAVQAARLGAPVSFIGFVGNDSYGRSFEKLCRDENIDIGKLRRSEKYPTGIGFIVCSKDGHNIITIDIGANYEMIPSVINGLTGDIKTGDIVLIQLEIPVESALYAAKVAREKGAVVFLNPAPATTGLSGRDLSFINFITPNETEAKICCGLGIDTPLSDEEVVEKLFARGCENVIVTRGEQGCLVQNRDGLVNIPAVDLPEIADSTGAGDSFNAALAVAVLEGRSISEACRFANAAAGLSCTRQNTIPSYHYRREVDAFVSNHDKTNQ